MKTGKVAICLFGLLAAVVGLASTASAGGGETLALRVNDAMARPGGTAAIVVRTYASRPIRQGQVCFTTALRGTGDSPFEAVESAAVFSSANDAVQFYSFDENNPAQPLMLRFLSYSASINDSDGPMLVLYVRLRDDLVAGAQYDLMLDAANTFVFDETGAPVPILPRDGRLRILGPGEPMQVSASAEPVTGSVALLSMQTSEIRALSGGQIALRYPTRLIPGPPKVFIDPRYGTADLNVTSLPGLVLVDFQSPDNSVNLLPGDLISVLVKTNPIDILAEGWPVFLDPALTFVRDEQGLIVPLEFESDLLVPL